MKTGFSVNYRNPGHWDIYSERSRDFRIRGQYGNVSLLDERDDPTRPHPREHLTFKTVTAAMAYVADLYMS